MYSTVVRWAREQRTGGPSEKAVLLVLAAAADQRGVCKLSTRKIARAADTDQATAWRILGRLADRDLVTWTVGYGSAPSTYQLRLVDRPP